LSEALNIEALAKAKDINGNTPLHLAIAKKYLPIVEILLPYFSLQDLSEPNRAGLSLIDALLENFPEQFKDLIKLIRTPPESSIKNSHVLLGPVGSTAPPKTEKHCCIS
jgi:ankyrin repeat protein